MPKRELKHPQQVVDWLNEWGEQLKDPGEMPLLGSAGLLWHVARIGPDNRCNSIPCRFAGPQDFPERTTGPPAFEICSKTRLDLTTPAP